MGAGFADHESSAGRDEGQVLGHPTGTPGQGTRVQGRDSKMVRSQASFVARGSPVVWKEVQEPVEGQAMPAKEIAEWSAIAQRPDSSLPMQPGSPPVSITRTILSPDTVYGPDHSSLKLASDRDRRVRSRCNRQVPPTRLNV